MSTLSWKMNDSTRINIPFFGPDEINLGDPVLFFLFFFWNYSCLVIETCNAFIEILGFIQRCRREKEYFGELFFNVEDVALIFYFLKAREE